MSVVDDIQKLLSTFKPDQGRAEELKRLGDFLNHMKAEGIATTREYDLPQLDTIGRHLRS